MKGEFKKFPYSDTATKALFIYDLKTGKMQEHINTSLSENGVRPLGIQGV